jgi:cytidylate kinase
MKTDIKIAISGRSGCGNTTVSRMVAEKLNLQFINFTFRSLAEERNVTLKDIMELAGKDDSIDKEVDARQTKLAAESGGCVLGSRLAIWILKEADLKIYLDADPQIRASRIVTREGGKLNEVAAFTAERDKKDHDRYLRLYGIDTDNFQFVDLVVDAGSYTAEQIRDKIVECALRIK